MTNLELRDLAHLSLVDGFVGPTGFQRGAQVRVQDGLALVKSRSLLSWYNVALRFGGSLTGEEVLAAALEFFDEPERGFKVYAREWADDDIATAAGKYQLLPPDETIPYMVIDSAPSAISVPDGFEIRSAPTKQLVNDFAEVCCAVFAEDEFAETATRDVLDFDGLRTPFHRVFVAYDNDQPVSVASIWLSRSMAGVYWVGTLPEYRRRGIGDAVTRAATRQAFTDGASAVTLQASKAGYGLYERVGYREVGRFTMYRRLAKGE